MNAKVWLAGAFVLVGGLAGCEKGKTRYESVAASNPSLPSPAASVLSPAASPAGTIGDRKVAAWVHSLGGSVVIEHEMKQKTVAVAADLPAGDFKLLQVNLANNEKVDDAGLVNLAGLSSLEGLNLNRTKITAVGLAKLTGLPNLKYLNLCVPTLGDEALAHLKSFPNLRSLELSYSGVTDAGLEPLKALNDLTTLYLSNTKATDAGVDGLRKALPNLNVKR